ncbi:hypothetical protein [Saccharopolyspora flava]|uniref:DUF3800 domain-containing protein n=1 Tax=Saccharopolyspora flava TaxID=95161 RepID=A0A1I6P4U9_9PSEU|nr:hypothetical protein [Saccharopolyspora flava]SFS35244.1 hypothetical protein SAMN05660874_00460 [Saccharopolyspora flava]
MITPSPGGLEAFADESFREAEFGGFYVLAAAVFEPGAEDAARDAMHVLQGKRAPLKLHWNEMNQQLRHNAVKTIADLDGIYVVAVGSPVPARRQERARAACLVRLTLELHGLGVTELHVESRTPELDQRDVNTVRGARFCLPSGSMFRIDHIPGKREALLWAADIAAGAVRAQHEGRADYQPLLGESLHEIAVTTDC